MKFQRIIFISALCILFMFVCVGIVSQWWTPWDPLVPHLDTIKLSPSLQHLMGTDDRGRDVLSRVMVGTRFSLSIGILSTFCALLIGSILGFVGGYFGGIWDSILAFLTNIILAFPSLLLAIGISSIMMPGYNAIFITLILIGWAGFAKLVRAETLRLKHSDHVEASRVIGASAVYLFIRHILPLCSGILITAVSLRIGVAILTESSLSFLGLGIQPPHPTWGNMISQGRDYFRSAPWMTFFPGVMITALIISLNLFAENYKQLYKNKYFKKR